METSTHNLNFMCLRLEEMLSSINFQNLEDLSKTLKEGTDNPFFDATIFGLVTYLTEGEKENDWGKIQETIGNDFYNDLLEIKDDIKLDRSIFGFFDRCFLANQVLAKHNFFLKFFERRDDFRFQIKKKVEGKNQVTRNLSSCVLEKFNGYNIIKHQLARKEKKGFSAIEVVYESIYDGKIPLPFFHQSNPSCLQKLHRYI